jgi:hypothetical protein
MHRTLGSLSGIAAIELPRHKGLMSTERNFQKEQNKNVDNIPTSLFANAVE